MSWKFYCIEDGLFEGTTMPHVRCFMVNDVGVTIEETGRGKSDDGCVSFSYTDGDLNIRQIIARRCKNDPQPKAAPYSLGPTCEIHIAGDKLSRSLTGAEGRRIADNISSFMREYKIFPLAVAPCPEMIVFDRISAKYLKLNEGNRDA